MKHKTNEERKEARKTYKKDNWNKIKEKNRKYRLKNAIAIIEYGRIYYLKKKEEKNKKNLELGLSLIRTIHPKYKTEEERKIGRKEYDKKRYLENSNKNKEYSRKNYLKNTEIICKKASIKRTEQRKNALLALGGLVCVECGCIDPRCLCIGHIHDNGADERRNGLTHEKLYNKILLDPESAKLVYQVVCENCNKIKEFNRVKNSIIKPTKRQLYLRENQRKKRIEAINLLGGVFCKDCGYNDYRALQIDHVKGSGSKEARKIGENGILNKIINNPSCRSEYQVLCGNCNKKKAVINDETPRKHNKIHTTKT